MRIFLSDRSPVCRLVLLLVLYTSALSAALPVKSNTESAQLHHDGLPVASADDLHFDTRDYFAAPGYSGRAIEVDVVLDANNHWQSLRLGQHHEPIFLSPEGRESLQDLLNQYRGLSLHDRISVQGASRALTFEPGAESDRLELDGISNATITVRALHRSIVRASAKALQEKRDSPVPSVTMEADPDQFIAMSLEDLQRSGWLLRWQVSREQAEAALGRRLSDYKYQRYDFQQPGDFIDLWGAWLNAPTIGTAVLGEAGYQKLMLALRDPSTGVAKNAFWFASSGLHTHVVSGFKHGDSIRRLSLRQNDRKFTFHALKSIDIFADREALIPSASLSQILVLDDSTRYDPSLAASIQLSMRRKGKYLISDTSYFEAALPLVTQLLRTRPLADEELQAVDWRGIWAEKTTTITVLLLCLIVLSAFFIAQRKLLAHGAFVRKFRLLFLTVTLFFIGFYAQGQLSVTNIYTLLQAVLGEIPWSFFLSDPVIFILWSYVFISLLIWGRGLYCGWLCPFGVLQEFSSILAKKLSIKQWRIKQQTHRHLQWLKYIVLVGLLLTSLFSQVIATQLSEIEPFKTAITLYFVRSLPYLFYAAGLLLIGLFVHKPFCRYLCPLGAGLAVVGLLRRFSLLDRRAECGSPCQLCRHKCEIGAIAVSGKIDYNECVQCMECVVILRAPAECAVTMRAEKRSEQPLANKMSFNSCY